MCAILDKSGVFSVFFQKLQLHSDTAMGCPLLMSFSRWKILGCASACACSFATVTAVFSVQALRSRALYFAVSDQLL
ncbi:hypothetical protein SCA6_014670 [Theobroma cacao]